MKKLLAVTLVIILALGLSATALAEVPAPEKQTVAIESGTHATAEFGGDLSEIVAFRISFDITNFDKYAGSPDGADVQIVLNSGETGWKNISEDGGVFGAPNTWNNTMLSAANASYLYNLEFTIEAGWFHVNVGNWNDMEGSFTVTLFTQEQLEIAKTGVLSFIGIAGAVLAASGTGAFIAGRKLKKSK